MSRIPESLFRHRALFTATLCAILPALASAQDAGPATLEVLDVSAERGEVSSESTGSYTGGATTTTMKKGEGGKPSRPLYRV
ncbi:MULTISPECIES: hypothetical protein [Marinobacter]|uniref:TonB-dependent receptor n=1 Tax=Marinobacter metalliresistant TaxID=2961995 RepID=A0ABZ2W151_9GAMM|nr:hypothetical protein [Marinobacter sp. Arc7-DN-1]AXS84732.1 hypothetical protein D0851_17925 [Marinobacter sp. Arc7-DN-1]